MARHSERSEDLFLQSQGGLFSLKLNMAGTFETVTLLQTLPQIQRSIRFPPFIFFE
jgi:hypothetical protein